MCAYEFVSICYHCMHYLHVSLDFTKNNTLFVCEELSNCQPVHSHLRPCHAVCDATYGDDIPQKKSVTRTVSEGFIDNPIHDFIHLSGTDSLRLHCRSGPFGVHASSWRLLKN